MIVEPDRENVTGIDLQKLRLGEKYRRPRVVGQVLSVDRFDWRATENAALHLRVDRRGLVAVQARGSELHARAEILLEVRRRREVVTIVREVGEVHAQRRDNGNLRIRQALPGLHRLHIGGQSGDRVLDERHRIDAEDAEN